MLVGETDPKGMPWVLKTLRYLRVDPVQANWGEVLDRIHSFAA